MKTGIAEAPVRASGRQSLGVGTAAGIGFTVALFITELAFEDQAMQEQAKLAVLVASVVAALLAVGLLRPSKSSRRETEAPSAPAPV